MITSYAEIPSMINETMNPLALVIEDNEDLNEIFSRALEETGFVVETALDGQQALDHLNELTPELIILDLHLPYVSGEEILHQIRANKRLEKTPIIVATANLRWGRSLQDKATLVLVKPVQYTLLRLIAERLKPR